MGTNGGDDAPESSSVEETVGNEGWEDWGSALVAADLQKPGSTDKDHVWAILDRDHGHEHKKPGHCAWLASEFEKLLVFVRARERERIAGLVIQLPRSFPHDNALLARMIYENRVRHGSGGGGGG